MTSLQCLLCDRTGPDVRPRLVEFLVPEPRRFDVITACVDVPSCRVRIESAGDTWPLAPTSREALTARSKP